MAEPLNAIETVGLSKALLGTSILHNVCLRVAEAECVVILGENGSGKTTLLRCLAGAIRPDQGQLSWYGHSASVSADTRRLIGFVAHECQVYSHFTVYENLLFAARMNDLPAPAKRAQQLLAEMDLVRYAQQSPSRLSRGQRQRLSIARAIIHDPHILLMDEPFTGLDAPGRIWLLELISKLRVRGRAICMTTHDADMVQQLAPRILILRCGELHDRAEETNRLGQWVA